METGKTICCSDMVRNSYNTRNGCQSLCGTPADYGCHFPSLAMVYGPVQYFDELYEINKALCRGTLFKKLDMPFEGAKTFRRGVEGKCVR